jgi:hypothetical protein
MDDSIGIILFIGVLVLIVLIYVWHFSRSSLLLEQWASDNGYELLRREYRVLRRGPFFWTTSRGQTVYYVEIRDCQGHIRAGWVRCGSWWTGLLSDKVEAHWEDENA